MKKDTRYTIVCVHVDTHITKRKIVTDRSSVFKDGHLFVTPKNYRIIADRLQFGALCVS